MTELGNWTAVYKNTMAMNILNAVDAEPGISPSVIRTTPEKYDAVSALIRSGLVRITRDGLYATSDGVKAVSIWRDKHVG